MRICAFSDIHGNGPAFDAAWEKIHKENVDCHIFLGDICGYYFDQIEIFEKLVSLPKILCVLGNHDHAFLEIISGKRKLNREYLVKYGNSMKVLQEKDYDSFVKWLHELPLELTLLEGRLKACHGSPWNVLNGYVYPDSEMDLFQNYEPTFYLLGHTHYPMFRQTGQKFIINPGSLGQPRDGGWPTYAIVDTNKKEVVFRTVTYPKQKILEKIQAIDLETPYLQEIIRR